MVRIADRLTLYRRLQGVADAANTSLSMTHIDFYIKLVEYILADGEPNGDDLECALSVQGMGKALSTPWQTVQKSLKLLAEAGIIERKFRGRAKPTITVLPAKYWREE